MNLYNLDMKSQTVRVLYTLYTNPFESVTNIEEKAKSTKNSYARSIRQLLGQQSTYTRMQLFDHLGYIDVPEISVAYPEITDDRQKRILKLMKKDSDISISEIAYAIGYAPQSVGAMVNTIYERFNFERGNTPTKLARLKFFGMMGWFDVARLKKDAYVQWVALSTLNKDDNYGRLNLSD